MGSEHRDKYGNAIGSDGDWASSSVNSNNQKVLERLQKNHMDNVTSYDFSTQAGGLFWGADAEDEGMGRTATSEAAQAAWIKKAYSEIGESSKNIAVDQQQILAANEYALQLSGEAEGKVQELISNTLARTIHSQALADRNEMYLKYLQMKSIDNMEQIDREAHENAVKNSFSYYVADPYNSASYEYAKNAYGIEKLEGHRMPDFK